MNKNQKVEGTIDVTSALDETKFTLFQKAMIFIAAIAVLLDGFDSQLMSYVAPVLKNEWNLKNSDLSPAMLASVIGMAFGSAISGVLADKYGRKKILLLSLSFVGFFTCMVGTQHQITGIVIFRFIAGLGIGGALPIATTIAAEFSPLRYRTMVITSTIVCVPLGGMLAGFFAEIIMPYFGWRKMFYIGGAMPLVLLVICLFALPETPKYLVRFPNRWNEIRKTLNKMGQNIPEGVVFVDSAEKNHQDNTGYLAPFKDNLARDSSAIWFAFFFCLAAVYSAFIWLPTMLSSQDIAIDVARRGLTAYNLGGVVGALACAWFITRFGSFWPLVLCSAAGAISALSLQFFDIQNHITLLIIILCLHGLFVNAVQSVMYALCAYIYPTSIRANGTSTALMFGRLGAISATFAGAPIITFGGSSGYLWLLGGSMIIVTIALIIIRRHIPLAISTH